MAASEKNFLFKSANLFITRRRILEYLKTIENDRKLSFFEIEDIADRLLEYGEHALEIIVNNFSRQRDTLIIKRYEHLMMYMYEPSFLKYLVSLGFKKNIYIRTSLLNLLNFYGFNLYQSPYYGEIEEFYSKVYETLMFFLRKKENDFDDIKNFLQNFYFLSDDEKIRLLEIIDESSPYKRYFLYNLLIWTGFKQVLFEIIRNLGKRRTERAIILLNFLKKMLPFEYIESIDKVLSKLTFSVIDHSCNNKKNDKRYYYKTMISDLNKENSFMLFFEVRNCNKPVKFLLTVNEFYFLSIDSYVYTDNESPIEKIYSLKEIKNEIAFDILADIVLNHLELEVPLPWQFTFLTCFVDMEKIIPKNYTCHINSREEFFINEYWERIFDMYVQENGWFMNEHKFCNIIEKWYYNTEPYEDIWRDHLFLRKIIREIILPEINYWKKRFYQLADYFFYAEGQQKLAFLIYKNIHDLIPDVESIEKNSFIKKLIMYNKDKCLLEMRRQK